MNVATASEMLREVDEGAVGRHTHALLRAARIQSKTTDCAKTHKEGETLVTISFLKTVFASPPGGTN